MNYKRLSVGRSLERAIADSIGLWASLVIFVAAHYVQTELTLSKIFSTLDIIINFKMSISILASGLGFYYEVKVVFERFASVFNIENVSMI